MHSGGIGNGTRSVTAAPLDLLPPADQPGEEVTDSLLLPRQGSQHRFPVASSLTQPQTTSSALKSWLSPGWFTGRILCLDFQRCSRTASSSRASALSQITFGGPACLPSVAPEMPPIFLNCCSHAAPSTPPLQQGLYCHRGWKPGSRNDARKELHMAESALEYWSS